MMIKRRFILMIVTMFVVTSCSLISCSRKGNDKWDLPGKVLFRTWRGDDSYQLAMLENGEIALLQITGIFSRWSPNGNFIATLSENGDISVLNVDGKIIQHIDITADDINQWDWFGSDEKILVAERTSHPGPDQHIYNLAVYDIETGEREQITNNARLNTITEIDVSSNGKKVTFARFWEQVPGPNMNVYLLNLETMEEIKIDARSSAPRFSQDGTKVVYDKFVGYQKDKPTLEPSYIMIYDIKTGETKPIVDRPMSGKSFNLSKDGKTLIFSDDNSILRLNVDTGKVIRMLDKPLVKGSSRKHVKDRNPDWFVS